MRERVLVGLMILLLITSNSLIYYVMHKEIQRLRAENESLRKDYKSLEDAYHSVVTGYKTLEVKYGKLMEEYNKLHSELNNLKKPKVYIVGFTWFDYPSTTGKSRARVYVALFNAGIEEARNVNLTITLYDEAGQVLGSLDFIIGIIAGRGKFEDWFTVYHYGTAYKAKVHVEWSS